MCVCVGGVIPKPKLPELSSLFATHRLDMIKPPVKFNEYIPYGFGVTVRAQFLARTDGHGLRVVART